MSTVTGASVRAVTIGSAISSADRNWLDTSPRTVTRSGARRIGRPRTDRQRRIAFVAEIADVGAEARAARRRDRRSAARASAARRRSRSVPPANASAAVSGRSAVPALPRNSRAARVGNAPPCPCTTKSRACRLALDADAERAQRVQHPVDVVGVEQPAHRRVAGRERGEQQRSIGDALRSRQRDHALGTGGAGARSRLVRRRLGRGRHGSRGPSAGTAAGGREPRVPGATCRGGAREHRLERRPVARGHHGRDAIELRAVRLDLGQQRVAIGEGDVAPHFRRTGRDAREIAEAAGGIAEDVRGVGPRRQLIHEREGEQVRQVRHGGEDPVVDRGIELAHPRAAGGPEAATVATASGSVSGSGVSTTLRSRYSVANAAAAPVCSVPAIGWPGTKRGSAAPRCGARRGDHVLLGAAGVGDDRARAEPAGACAANSPGNCATGAASSTTSASASSRVQSASSVTARSTMPSVAAPRRGWHGRGRCRRPTPRGRRRFSASANEPPIRPTPTTTSLRSSVLRQPRRGRRSVRPSAGERGGERVEKAAVFRGQPDRDAQALGQPVVRDRTHDHALLAAAAGRRAPHPRP